MGNTNGREEGMENGGGGDDVSGGPYPAQTARVATADLTLSSHPHAPRQSRPPLLLSSQTPVLASQRNDGTSLNHRWLDESQRVLDYPLEKGIPTIITWSFGGHNVAVEGSWDNWRTRKNLQRSGKDHSILLVLPSGIFRYKFFVDGEVKHIPDLPSETDDMGSVCNLLDVHDYVPENLDSVVEFEGPPSPESSYSQNYSRDEDFGKEPVLVPPQLHSWSLCSDGGLKPQHVVLNHLFTEKGQQAQSVMALGMTHRFQSKYVTVLLYKPLKT